MAFTGCLPQSLHCSSTRSDMNNTQREKHKKWTLDGFWEICQPDTGTLVAATIGVMYGRNGDIVAGMVGTGRWNFKGRLLHAV